MGSRRSFFIVVKWSDVADGVYLIVDCVLHSLVLCFFILAVRSMFSELRSRRSSEEKQDDRKTGLDDNRVKDMHSCPASLPFHEATWVRSRQSHHHAAHPFPKSENKELGEEWVTAIKAV